MYYIDIFVVVAVLINVVSVFIYTSQHLKMLKRKNKSIPCAGLLVLFILILYMLLINYF